MKKTILTLILSFAISPLFAERATTFGTPPYVLDTDEQSQEEITAALNQMMWELYTQKFDVAGGSVTGVVSFSSTIYVNNAPISGGGGVSSSTNTDGHVIETQIGGFPLIYPQRKHLLFQCPTCAPAYGFRVVDSSTITYVNLDISSFGGGITIITGDGVTSSVDGGTTTYTVPSGNPGAGGINYPIYTIPGLTQQLTPTRPGDIVDISIGTHTIKYIGCDSVNSVWTTSNDNVVTHFTFDESTPTLSSTTTFHYPYTLGRVWGNKYYIYGDATHCPQVGTAGGSEVNISTMEPLIAANPGPGFAAGSRVFGNAGTNVYGFPPTPNTNGGRVYVDIKAIGDSAMVLNPYLYLTYAGDLIKSNVYQTGAPVIFDVSACAGTLRGMAFDGAGGIYSGCSSDNLLYKFSADDGSVVAIATAAASGLTDVVYTGNAIYSNGGGKINKYDTNLNFITSTAAAVTCLTFDGKTLWGGSGFYLKRINLR